MEKNSRSQQKQKAEIPNTFIIKVIHLGYIKLYINIAIQLTSRDIFKISEFLIL